MNESFTRENVNRDSTCLLTKSPTLLEATTDGQKSTINLVSKALHVILIYKHATTWKVLHQLMKKFLMQT